MVGRIELVTRQSSPKEKMEWFTVRSLGMEQSGDTERFGLLLRDKCLCPLTFHQQVLYGQTGLCTRLSSNG